MVRVQISVAFVQRDIEELGGYMASEVASGFQLETSFPSKLTFTFITKCSKYKLYAEIKWNRFEYFILLICIILQFCSSSQPK